MCLFVERERPLRRGLWRALQFGGMNGVFKSLKSQKKPTKAGIRIRVSAPKSNQIIKASLAANESVNLS